MRFLPGGVWIVCGLLVVSAGCGGSNNNTGGGSTPTPTATATAPPPVLPSVTATGRYTITDVTPANLLDPVGGVPVSYFQYGSAAPSGLVTGNILLQNKDEKDDGVVVGEDILFEYRRPVLIDINTKTLTRLSADRPGGGQLTQGSGIVLSALGDAYGYYAELDAGDNIIPYRFLYSPATGATQLEQGGVVPEKQISDLGQMLLRDDSTDTLLVTNYTAATSYSAGIASGIRVASPISDYNAYPQYINAAGTVTGTLMSQANPRRDLTYAFVWQNGTTTVLPPLAEGANTSAIGIADDGRIFGFARTNTDKRTHLVVWQDGAIRELPEAYPGQQVVSVRIVGANRTGGILADFYFDYRLWQNGAWLDLNQELQTQQTSLLPVYLFDDGRILCTSYSRLVLLTPRG